MKEIKQNSDRHELALIHKQNRNQGIDFCLPKNTEIKIRFINSIYVDCLDAYYG
jgi:hypothetical protein